MMPLADTFRIRLFLESAMKRFPEASAAIPRGSYNDSEVAAPPSPEKPAVPFPATVVMMPLCPLAAAPNPRQKSTMQILIRFTPVPPQNPLPDICRTASPQGGQPSIQSCKYENTALFPAKTASSRDNRDQDV